MIISRGMVYGKELDEYVWREREKYAIRGFVCGALCMCIMWMIVLGFEEETMAMNYQIIVSSMEETFVAYTAEDMDEATGFAIERIEWEEER